MLALLGVGWALASAVIAWSEGRPPAPGRWPSVLMSLVGAGFFGAGAAEAWRGAPGSAGRGSRKVLACVEACAAAYFLVEAAHAAFRG